MEDRNFLKIMKEVDENYIDDIPTTGFLDSGSYIFNAVLSGSIYGGFPNNRISVIAGPSGTGKTFFSMSVVKTFLENHEDGSVVWFDTEFALDKEFFRKRDISPERIYLQQPEHLQEFRHKTLKILQKYEEMKNRPPLLIILDSLGMLPSKKEVDDATEGNDTRDMTRAQIVRSIFRTITRKSGLLSVPIIITNHTYDTMSMYSPQELSGGGGVKYASSNISFLSKLKDKDDASAGVIIKANMYKSRFSKEKQIAEMKLSYKTGVDRYYGLFQLAVDGGLFEQISAQKFKLPDGQELKRTEIIANLDKYMTPNILDKIEEIAQKEFSLGE